jgi:uncharacterized protein YwqG
VKAEFRDAVRETRAEMEEAVRKARSRIHRRPRQTHHPGGEPLSEQEAESIVEAYRRLARPALLLRPDASADPASAAARLGGPAWFTDGEEWPRNAAGLPLEFVAQVNFAQLPPLPGFPRQGVARFFVGRDDLWGADFDAPDRSDVRVLWYEGEQSGGRHQPPAPPARGGHSPFQDDAVRASGLALRPEPAEDLPDFYSWQLQERLERHAGRDGLQAVEDRLVALCETRAFAHRIGGHPTFTQYDFRRRGQHDDLDVVLLGLSSDDAVMWGDAGEAAFLMRATDLERRDFSRVAFYWDCH